VAAADTLPLLNERQRPIRQRAGIFRPLCMSVSAVTDSPHDRPWGIYSGYFQDPDGHLWEIIWNPALSSLDQPSG
jgi:hypothetical protein